MPGLMKFLSQPLQLDEALYKYSFRASKSKTDVLSTRLIISDNVLHRLWTYIKVYARDYGRLILGYVAPARLFVVGVTVMRYVLFIIYFTSDKLLFHIYTKNLNSCC